MAKPKLGSGGRFKALVAIEKKRGAKNPAGLAAFIGRRKYGNRKFQGMAARGRMK